MNVQDVDVDVDVLECDDEEGDVIPQLKCRFQLEVLEIVLFSTINE